MMTGKTIGVWSLGLIGGGGTVATGGSLIFTSAYPTGDTQLTREGFSWNPMKPKMGTDTRAEIASSFNFPAYNCFKTFFPGVDVGTEVLKDSTKEREIQNDPLANAAVPTSDGEENQSSPIGCALVGFSYKKPSANQQPDLVLKSEIVVKNENFGWALWAGLSRSSSSGQDFRYRLIFLKKEGETDKWSVMGGYMWSDIEFSTDGQIQNKLHILVPGDPQDWGNLMRQAQVDSKTSYKEYSGFWEESKEEEKEIFQTIKIYGQEEKRAEILGKTNPDFTYTEPDAWNYGFHSTAYSYDKDQKGFLQFKTWPNIKEILSKLYAPFAGKKGKWENMQKYCSYNRYGRFLGKEDMEKLKQFCYTENK